MNLQKSQNEIKADQGKIPPQAVEIEKAVLGSLMLEKNAYYKINDILTPQSFYDDRNGVVFGIIQKLAKQGKPIDLLLVTEELRTIGELERIGGPPYITELTFNVVGAKY